MSVVGFDVGNDTSCVALARKRGIDVIMNKESKRDTPTVVCFGDKMRFLGTDGAAKMGLSPKSTVHQLKRLLGKKFADPDVQADIQRLPFAVKAAADGSCLVDVMYRNELHTFTTEQLLAMVLVDLKAIAEKETGSPITDSVVSVPTYYTEAERYATLNAASIAGINCLRVMNENTATALAYGIYKTDLPDTEPVHVAFVDIGHTSTQVSIVAFKKSQLQVKAHAWDRNVGGRDFDEALFDHYCAEFQTNYKINVKSNAKAAFKLRTACEKVKKVLSANSEAPLSIEMLMDDKDVKAMMNREKFEKLAEPTLQRLTAPMKQALVESGLKLEDISSVEVVGSSTRIPSVCRIIEEFFQKPASRTMNAKECVSRGCALQCAMLSPVFRVREFEVIDAYPFSAAFSWDKDGTPTSTVLFERGCSVPNAKLVTFLKSAPFTVTAAYTDDSLTPAATPRTIGTFTVGPFTVPAGAEKAKLKVKFGLNLHGLVTVDQAQSIEEVEEEAPASAAPADAKMEDAAPAKPAENGSAAPAPEMGAAPMEADGAAATPAPAAEKKKKVIKTDVPVARTHAAGMTQKQLDAYFEAEVAMQGEDRQQEETNERKNALEAYVYDLRNKLYDQYAKYVRDEDRDALSGHLTAMEDWLYDEGEDQPKSVYVAKLDELKKLGAPVEGRYQEDQNRPAAADELKRLAETYQGLATAALPQYAHISDEEKATVVREAQAALQWVSEKLALQSQARAYDPPVLLTADIVKKRDTLDRVCKPILSKPAPAPAPKEEPKPAADAAPQPMEAETPAAGAEADAEASAGEPMQA